MAEIPNDPLLTAANQQTEVNVEAQPRSGRSTRAYKVAGITFLVAVLIVGQALVAYFLISQKGDLKSLQQENNNLQSQMTQSRSAFHSMSLPANSVPLLMDDTLDQGFAEGTAVPPQRTKCQQEAAGGRTALPGCRPVCDEHGLYQKQQCWNEMCWCVNPFSGEMIPRSIQPGPTHCSTSRSAGFGRFQ